MKRLRGLLTGCFVLLMPSACSAVTSQENFRMIIGESVGKSIDLPPRVTNAYPEDLVSSTHLPNGNIENQYRYQGACRYFYEIDPKTRIIVGWRYEGSERDCRINP